MHRQQAFSLMELLVVIAIISVLAAILLPTLERSLEMSRRIVCMSNQKQQYAGAMQCALDNNNVLPWHRGADSGYATINNKCGVRGGATILAYDTNGTVISPYSEDTGLNAFISRGYLSADLYRCPSQTSVPVYGANSSSGYSGVHYAYRYNSYRTINTNNSNTGDSAAPGCTRNAFIALPFNSPETWRLIDRGMKQVFTTPSWQSKALFSDYGAANNGLIAYKAGTWAHEDGGNAVLHDGSALWVPGPEPLENGYGGMSYGLFDPMVRAVR